MVHGVNQNPDGNAVPRLAAIILAAGYSSRMGQFKPLLSVGNCTAVEAVVRMFVSAGVSDVWVVLGHRADELRPVVESLGARCVINPNYDLGMFSSVKAGIAGLPKGTEACFITPVDIPLVRAGTVRRLARCFAETRKEIIYPVFNKRRGHPALVSRAILAEVGEAPMDAWLSTVLGAHQTQSYELFVPDEAIHWDMDTPEELARIRDCAARREVPSPEECEAILEEFQPDDRVARHSRAVAQVAHRLAVALAERGVQVEPALVQAAGLLHDVAKGKPEHAEAGARLLRELEFAKVADLVGAHTDHRFAQSKLDEAAIVYLADKLVSGERLVGLEQRFKRSRERFQGNSEALASASRRCQTAEAIAREVEGRLGTGLQQLFGDLADSTAQSSQLSSVDQGLEPRGCDGIRLSRQ